MPVAEPSVQIALKRILVATDFSECSERALLTSLGIAHRYGSKLHMVHVVPSEGYGVAGAGMLGAVNFARHGARDLESELLRKGYLEGIRYQISVEKGEIWPVISRIVEEEHTDLIVVGTHGRSGLGRVLLGSVAEKIFRQASLSRADRGTELSTVASAHRPAEGCAFSLRISRRSQNVLFRMRCRWHRNIRPS